MARFVRRAVSMGAVMVLLGITGCRFQMGNSDTLIRVSARIPDVVVESGAGEYIHYEGQPSEKGSLYFWMRGTW